MIRFCEICKKSVKIPHLNHATDEEKLTVPTAWDYDVKQSKHSKKYYYITEIESDGFGQTERIITGPVHKDDMYELSNKIRRAIPNIIKSR